MRMSTHLVGIDGKIADTLNELIELHAGLAAELRRFSRAVDEEGRTSQRASLGSVSGAWAESVESVNNLIVNLVHPTAEMARVIGAVARGDLSPSARPSPRPRLSAYARPEERQRALRAGFDMHLAKPERKETLVASVLALVRLSDDAFAARDL